MQDSQKEYQEEINITTNTTYLNEKSLEKDSKLSETIFQLILCTFSSSLFIQIISTFKHSYLLLDNLTNIFLLCLAVIAIINSSNKFRLSVKSYLIFSSIVIGIVIGL